MSDPRNARDRVDSGSRLASLVAGALLALLVTGGIPASACGAASARQPSVGGWLADRGPSDPRPYDEPLLGDGLLGRGFFERKNRLWVEKGLSWGGYVSANVQAGTEGGSSHAISEALLLITWEPVRRDSSAGRLVVGVAHDQTFGQPTTRKFADRQGLVETPNDLDTDPDLTFTTLGLLHWEHEFWTGSDRGWAYRAGQIYAPSYFGIARYLDDDRRYFMARPLAAAGGAQWVGLNDIGLGVNLLGWRGPYYASGAIIDGKANRQYPQFDSFFDGEFLYLGEVGYERDPDGPEETRVSVTLSHLDVHDGDAPAKGPGQAAMVSMEKRFRGRWAVAGRWSKSFERLSSDYRELYSLGMMWLGLFGHRRDLVALGIFTGDPSDPERGWESGAELSYRFQLTQAVDLMPDLQYWSRDDAHSETRSWVWGLRVNFSY